MQLSPEHQAMINSLAAIQYAVLDHAFAADKDEAAIDFVQSSAEFAKDMAKFLRSISK